MTQQQITNDIGRLSQGINDLKNKARVEGRNLNGKEAGLIQDAENKIHELLSKPVGEPLSLLPPHNLIDGLPLTSAPRTALTGRDYRSLFNLGAGRSLDNGGFKDAGEFLRVLESGRYDPRLMNSAGELIPSAGGFSVPQTYIAEWLDSSLPNEIVRQLCRIYPMTSETVDAVGFDGADMSTGNTHGGLAMEFLAEGADANKQTPKLRKITLTAKMAAIYVDASLELIQDGRGFAENLQTALIKSIGYGLDKYLLTGNGAGCPQGVLNAACKIEVTKEIGQDKDSIVYGNLKRMFARQLNPEKSVWLFNNTAIPELLEISIGVGTGGNFVPLLNESNGKFTIFGRPVYFTSHLPKVGDAGDAAFVDFSYYSLGIRSDATIDITDVHRWVQRERSFRVLLRFDGQCTLNTAITPAHGDTLSPVVVLGERA